MFYSFKLPEVITKYIKYTSRFQAQSVARAKQLRAKFEKWQNNEIEQEIKEGRIDVYSQLISNESIESAKA